MAHHSETAGDGEPYEYGLEELGTLVLRVWQEPEAERGLRVRMLASQGAGESASVAVFADPEAAGAAVRTWLLDRWNSTSAQP